MTAADAESGHVLFRIKRRNGRILHTFERNAYRDWTLTTPTSAKLRSRWVGPNATPQPPPWPDELDPETGMIVYTTDGTWEADPRSHCTLKDGTYDLGDGIPEIEDAKLHRILDGLVAAGLPEIDSDGLIRVITARR